MNVKRHELRLKTRELENIINAGKNRHNDMSFLTEKAKEVISDLTLMECKISTEIDLEIKNNVLRLAYNFIEGV